MKRCIGCFVVLSVALLTNIGAAQVIDPQIQAILKESAAAYRQAKTISLTMETVQNMGPISRTTKTTLQIEKPTRLSASIANGDIITRVVSDGQKIYSVSSIKRLTYIEQPAESFQQMIMTLARNGGAGVGLLPILLTSERGEEQMLTGKPTSVRRLPGMNIDGAACDVIEAIFDKGDQSRRVVLSIDKGSHLLRRATIGPAAPNAKPQVVETYTRISTGPIAASAFKFTPAPGAVASVPEPEPEMFDPRVKVSAAPLAIGGADMEGKPVNLDQFKGKVLLIDFWATWCGPCVAELPNVIAAYDKYHAQGFEILGVSLDNADARAKLEKFISDNKMTWRQIYDGKQWQAANAVAWGVRAIPFTVLIGKDGKIAAVGARGEELAPAIEAAIKQP